MGFAAGTKDFAIYVQWGDAPPTVQPAAGESWPLVEMMRVLRRANATGEQVAVRVVHNPSGVVTAHEWACEDCQERYATQKTLPRFMGSDSERHLCDLCYQTWVEGYLRPHA